MDDPSARYYQPPENHADDIRRMVLWLSVFFVAVVLLAGLVIGFADRLAQHLPFSVEKRFVAPYEAMAVYLQDEPGTPEALRREKVEVYLQSLADDLAEHMRVPEDYVVQVHYLEQDIVNAFATLGGHVFVFRGLLEELPDENSLSMILAHEIAHIKHRDPAAALGRGLALQMLYSFVSGDYSEELALQGGEMGMLVFSREQETRADLAALGALQRQYGHVRGFDTLFARMDTSSAEDSDSAGDDSIDQWLSSHPSMPDRIHRLRSEARARQWSLEGQVVPLPDNIRSLAGPGS